MKNTFSLIMVTISLLGCYSVGGHTQYVNNETNLSVYPVYSSSNSNCGLYLPLQSKPIPELPFEEIKQAKLHSTGQAEAIMVAHIRQLREYVVNRKKEEDAHYAAYLSKCALALK